MPVASVSGLDPGGGFELVFVDAGGVEQQPAWTVDPLTVAAGLAHSSRQRARSGSSSLKPAVSEVWLPCGRRPPAAALVYTWVTVYARGMSELPTESIRDLRAHLAAVVERADRDDQATVITRRGKPVAAVVSIEVLRKYQEWDERELNRIIDERMADRSGSVPLEDVIAETLARSE